MRSERFRPDRRRWFWVALTLIAMALALVALGFGCADMSLSEGDDDSAYGDDDMAGDDDGSDDDSGDDDSGDDDTDDDQGPCGDNTWGEIPMEGDLILVMEGGSALGDGTLTAPLDTLANAIAAARDKGDPSTIALGPGSFPAAVELTEVAGDFTDRGLVIAGCSPAESKIVAADPAQPAIAVRAVDDVTLTGVTVEGGRPAIAISDHAGADTPIVLESVVVQYASGVGIVIDDIQSGDTTASLTNVEFSGTTVVDGNFGWGISVQRASASITGGRVHGVTGVGVFGHLADLQLDGTTIDTVATDAAGQLGRGVHLQLMSTGSVRNLVVNGCADAGIYVHMGMDLTLESNDVDGTLAAGIPDSAATSGDGIVVTMGDETFSPEFFQTTLLGNDASAGARAGILIDGAWAELVGNTGVNNVFDPGAWGIVVQNSSVVGGSDSVYDIDTDPMQDPLEINTHELNWMQVGGG
jgi:Right handed beta helix region